MAESYIDKLQHPKWQKKRLKILERDNFTCQYCLDTETPLHIHHKKYTGNNPWDANDDDLISVCQNCHSILEDCKKDECVSEVFFIKKIQSDTIFNAYRCGYRVVSGEKCMSIYDLSNGCRHILALSFNKISIFYNELKEIE